MPAPLAKQEILPPRLPLQRIRDTFYVDLSKVANRALADDADNNGKGGWMDQGPDADMREFKAGDRTFGGASFKISEDPKSVVVLKSPARPKGDLPEKVAIPVGRKFDTLFFLHSGVGCNPGDKEFFHYVLHYADGKGRDDSRRAQEHERLACGTGGPVPGGAGYLLHSGPDGEGAAVRPRQRLPHGMERSAGSPAGGHQEHRVRRQRQVLRQSCWASPA